MRKAWNDRVGLLGGGVAWGRPCRFESHRKLPLPTSGCTTLRQQSLGTFRSLPIRRLASTWPSAISMRHGYAASSWPWQRRTGRDEYIGHKTTAIAAFFVLPRACFRRTRAYVSPTAASTAVASSRSRAHPPRKPIDGGFVTFPRQGGASTSVPRPPIHSSAGVTSQSTSFGDRLPGLAQEGRHERNSRQDFARPAPPLPGFLPLPPTTTLRPHRQSQGGRPGRALVLASQLTGGPILVSSQA